MPQHLHAEIADALDAARELDTRAIVYADPECGGFGVYAIADARGAWVRPQWIMWDSERGRTPHYERLISEGATCVL